MKPVVAFALGGLTFLGASYVLHCGFGMGPWPCQSGDCRHKGTGDADDALAGGAEELTLVTDERFGA